MYQIWGLVKHLLDSKSIFWTEKKFFAPTGEYPANHHYCRQSEIWVLFLFPLHQPFSKPIVSTIYAFWLPATQENRGDDSLAVGHCYSLRYQFSTLGEKIGSFEGWRSEKLYSVLRNDL